VSIKLSDEQRKQSIASIKRYAAQELEQEMGDLKAGLLLEFFLKEIAPSVYNGAVADAQAYLRDRLSDLEGVCYHDEFGYWPKAERRRS
jgi:uncharacterized protein (DUF2164 family)